MTSLLPAVAPMEAASTRAAVPVLCAHCGTPLAHGADVGAFCCAGCATAFAIVRDLGLDQFYKRRRASDRPLRPAAEETEIDYASYVHATGAECALHLVIDGISCAACVWLIESMLAREPEITHARVNLTTRRLALRWTGAPTDANRYVSRVAALGFRLMPYRAEHAVGGLSAGERELLRAMALAGFAAGNVMLLSVSVWAGFGEGMGPATRDFLHWISALIALPVIAYSGRPFFRSAFAALSAGRTNMDLPISIGVLLTAGMSLAETWASGEHAYFDSAVTLLFFLLVGRFLDQRARGRARAAAEHLLALATSAVNVLRPDGTSEARRPEAVRAGEIALVAAGERIGVDGRITQGRSEVDTSLVTGEATPRPVAPDAEVYAGMLNLTAPIRVSVTHTGEGTLLAEIVRMMETAERARGRFTALSDRVARAYAPVVHTLAALTFAGWHWVAEADARTALLAAVAVLIITCPCALALAVPVVQVVASGRLMRGGILLKSATALERLAVVDTVVFDKTGTLTRGQPALKADPAPPPDALRLAASMARASRHPLARALVQTCPDAPVRDDVREYPGEGLAAIGVEGEIRLGRRDFCGIADEGAQAEPEMWLVVPGRSPVRFAFADRLRADAAATVGALKDDRLRLHLLSGDRAAAVAVVARDVGIGDWRAECRPADKVRALGGLREAGAITLMVGDGLNDAPALAAAYVSASPASAADISQTAADVVFQGERLGAVTELLAVARRAARLVRQNLAIALAYNAVAVPLAIAGQVTPLIAALAMSTSSLLVIVNALRLGRGRPT